MEIVAHYANTLYGRIARNSVLHIAFNSVTLDTARVNMTNTTFDNTTKGNTTRGIMHDVWDSAPVKMMQGVGGMAYYTMEILTFTKETWVSKLFSRKFWSNVFYMFTFLHDYPNMAVWMQGNAIYCLRFFVNVYIENLEYVQLLFAVLSPVSVIILLERMDELSILFDEVNTLREFNRPAKNKRKGGKDKTE